MEVLQTDRASIRDPPKSANFCTDNDLPRHATMRDVVQNARRPSASGKNGGKKTCELDAYQSDSPAGSLAEQLETALWPRKVPAAFVARVALALERHAEHIASRHRRADSAAARPAPRRGRPNDRFLLRADVAMAIREYFGPPCDSARILRVAADGGDEEPFSKGPPDRISVFSGGRSGPLAEILRVVLQNADRIEGRAVNDRESRFQAKQWRRWLEEFEADDED